MVKPFVFGLPPTVANYPYKQTDVLFDDVGGNTGNLAFQFAISRHIRTSMPCRNWGAPPAEIDSAGDVGIIPAANQLGSHVQYGGFAKKIDALKTRLVMIGLGAQSGLDGAIPKVPEGTIAWVRAIAEHAPTDRPSITVRGPFTREVLASHGLAEHAIVLGCPSLFINPAPRLGQRQRRLDRVPQRVAVAGAHESWKHLAKLEASLARMVGDTGGSYVCQHGLAMVRLGRGEVGRLEDKKQRELRDFIAPELDLDAFRRWARTYATVFFDILAWLEHYRRFDFVIGARIHGIILALQAGVPALCIAHDSRTRELCETMKVPYVLSRDVSDGILRKDLPDLYRFDGEAFDANRSDLARQYVAFLAENGLPYVNWLEAIAGSTAHPSA